MSRWISKADALAEKIRSLEAVTTAGLSVIVLQDGDLMTAITAGFEKSAKGCILVAWLGGKNPDLQARTLRIGSGYSVSVWYPKRPGERIPVATLAEAIAEEIHYWVDPSPGALIHPLVVASVEPVANKEFQIVEIRGAFHRV
jgi:hypothetical protein